MATRLSVNINKIATLRNSRGGNLPDVIQAAVNCEAFGAHGITVHPRPDERHIRYADVRALRPLIKTELNIEGNPMEEKFVALVLEVKPHQVTLVPDSTQQLTSDHGWDTRTHHNELKTKLKIFKSAGIRTSVFVDPDLAMIEGAHKAGADRVELYTEAYARTGDVAPYAHAAQFALSLGLQLNAGHDLNLKNLAYFIKHCPGISEVSIGHALIADALYLGLEETVRRYLREIKLI